ncbi:iron complex transport system permease protein [Paenibacillus phyllosphaerae]|uniref:Iron complex transport system permease protein n=1 Tax=Paenibacillus phyllosphaerae TaxID=274593 RepID=A0A7W5AZW1_9BACL|nr:iron ABC transporter permease [Paenibacillus phyllosphaerae]MBB3111707.1 iron complex transport system permease protein [Paenibacillus phyllosphaerae]
MRQEQLQRMGIPVTVPRHRRTLWATGFFLMLLIALSAANLLLGEQRIAPLAVWQALMGQGNSEHVLIVRTFRAPRLVIGLLVGASLAVSGAILQSVIRNPLAAPDVIGITGGASVAAVAFITFIPSAVSLAFLPLFAIFGAFGAALLIYALAWKKGVHTARLVLIGIGIASLLSGVTTFMLVFSPSYTAASSYTWLTGSIYGSTWQHVGVLLPWTVVIAAGIATMMRRMSVQLLGDELAAGLGSSVECDRFLLLMLSVALAGSAVAIGGVIGFVGFIAPHAARRLVGPVVNRLIPLSALIGGCMVALADLLARTLFMPLDIPVGVFTSAIGAPFFIYLLYRTRNNRM